MRPKPKPVWVEICDCLTTAFDGTNAPYIDRICTLSRSGSAAEKLDWWIQGIFEILEELINNGFFPKDGREEYLFRAIALLEGLE